MGGISINSSITQNNVYCIDVIEALDLLYKQFGSHYFNLIIIDPPYNQDIDEWDNFDNDDQYIEWINLIFVKVNLLLRDNGSLFFFHNNMITISEIISKIKKTQLFRLNNFIVWNKRFKESKYYEYLNGWLEINDRHRLYKMSEYILYYVKNTHIKLQQKRNELKIPQITISQEIVSESGGITGWYSNIEKGHYYPNSETILPITKHLGFTMDDLVPQYYKIPAHCVWNFDISEEKRQNHATPKPCKLIRDILRMTTKTGDNVLNLFSGSGNIEIECKRSNRNFIGIDNNQEYITRIKERLKQSHLSTFFPTKQEIKK